MFGLGVGRLLFVYFFVSDICIFRLWYLYIQIVIRICIFLCLGVGLFGISVYIDCDWDLYTSLFGLGGNWLLFGLVWVYCVPCFIVYLVWDICIYWLWLLFVYFFVFFVWVGCYLYISLFGLVLFGSGFIVYLVICIFLCLGYLYISLLVISVYSDCDWDLYLVICILGFVWFGNWLLFGLCTQKYLEFSRL